MLLLFEQSNVPLIRHEGLQTVETVTRYLNSIDS